MNNNKFVVRKRLFSGRRHWWVGRMINEKFVPYSDIFSPTGHSHGDKVEALKWAKIIEERLGHGASTDTMA